MKFKKELELIENQLYLFLNGYLDVIQKSRAEVLSPKSFYKKFLGTLKAFIKDTIQYLKFKNPTLKGKTIAFVESLNNVTSLDFLREDVVFYSPFKLKKINKKITLHNLYPKNKLYYDFKFFIFIIWVFLKSTKEKRKLYYLRWNLFFRAYGVIQGYILVLKNNEPNKVIFTNDHSIYARGLLLAAKQMGIKTIYVQHASVSKFYPPLIFDLSLLEGEDSYLKYKNIANILNKVELIGMPKFDKYSSLINKSKRVKSIGICYNMTDSLDDVLQLRNLINKDFKRIKVILRPHPTDNRLKYNKSMNNLLVSNSVEENSFQFLSNVDLIIASNSSIHVEAILMNVVSLYYNFSIEMSTLNDYYGFVKNGLCENIENYLDLKKVILEQSKLKSNVQIKSKFYNSVIGSTDYGKSGFLAKKLIKDF